HWPGKGVCTEPPGAKHVHIAGSCGSRMAKSAWQNPNNCKGITVEPDGTAENIRIGAIGTAPQAIADHGQGSETRREVLRTKQPSNLRDHTQHGKVAETAIDR